jgi:DNA-binding IclR family transcriptional regulator
MSQTAKRLSPTAQSPRNRVIAAERAFLLLKCFESPGELLTLGELARRSELYKNTILRLTTSANYMGFLRRDTAGRFYLGPEVRRLGSLVLGQTASPLEEAIRPALHRIVVSTKETASFYVIEGRKRVCLYRENPRQPARRHLEEGSSHALDLGAAGQILKAFRPRSRSKGAEEIRRVGWAVSKGARGSHLTAVAVPVFDGNNRLLGSLSVSGLAVRFTPSKIESGRRTLFKEAATLKEHFR